MTFYETINIDELVKSVIPAKAGIHLDFNYLKKLDSRFHGNDKKHGLSDFLRDYQYWGCEKKLNIDFLQNPAITQTNPYIKSPGVAKPS